MLTLRVGEIFCCFWGLRRWKRKIGAERTKKRKESKKQQQNIYRRKGRPAGECVLREKLWPWFHRQQQQQQKTGIKERRNFVGFFYIFGRIRTSGGKKHTQANKKHTQAHAAENAERENEKKDWLKLMTRGEEEEVHYILYQKHIFKVNSQPKKKNHFRMRVSSFSLSVRPNRNWKEFLGARFLCSAVPSIMLFYFMVSQEPVPTRQPKNCSSCHGPRWDKSIQLEKGFSLSFSLSRFCFAVLNDRRKWAWAHCVDSNKKPESRIQTHLPALAALDLHQVLRVAYDVRHHINVVLQREYHRTAVGRWDGNRGAI